ncbi:MAG: DUF177 domain-containing protein [Chloroflexi bacterium]|nr:DUF177 domain-containing protein [Chloroflexota bacterium]
MEFNVAQLLREPVGSTRHHKLCGEDGTDVRGDIEMVRTDRGILVRGRLSTCVETTCSRCLCSFSCPVTFDLEEEVFPTIEVFSGAPLPSPEDRDAFTIDEHHILDLGEAIRQYALLSLPMKPLCRQDCLGLCEQCGHNLNEGKCSCPARLQDPRWEKLQQLLSQTEDLSEQKTATRRPKTGQR